MAGQPNFGCIYFIFIFQKFKKERQARRTAAMPCPATVFAASLRGGECEAMRGEARGKRSGRSPPRRRPVPRHSPKPSEAGPAYCPDCCPHARPCLGRSGSICPARRSAVANQIYQLQYPLKEFHPMTYQIQPSNRQGSSAIAGPPFLHILTTEDSNAQR